MNDSIELPEIVERFYNLLFGALREMKAPDDGELQLIISLSSEGNWIISIDPPKVTAMSVSLKFVFSTDFDVFSFYCSPYFLALDKPRYLFEGITKEREEQWEEKIKICLKNIFLLQNDRSVNMGKIIYQEEVSG